MFNSRSLSSCLKEVVNYELSIPLPKNTCPAMAFPKVLKDPLLTAADCKAQRKEDIRAAKVESSRLLKHEQYHLNLACQVAALANRTLGATPTKKQAIEIRKKADALQTKLRKQYDSETDHGCISGKQNSWQQKIDGKLQGQTL